MVTPSTYIEVAASRRNLIEAVLRIILHVLKSCVELFCFPNLIRNAMEHNGILSMRCSCFSSIGPVVLVLLQSINYTLGISIVWSSFSMLFTFWSVSSGIQIPVSDVRFAIVSSCSLVMIIPRDTGPLVYKLSESQLIDLLAVFPFHLLFQQSSASSWQRTLFSL